MEYTTLGDTGLTVSRIAVGCGRFGRNDETKLADGAAADLVDRAIDLGVNFFDTANVYADGQSEEILGAALEGHDREFPVVATKVFFEMDGDNPNAQGLSRKAIEQELDNSLERLGMETVDLYQIHRWDDGTPIEETLGALDDAVRRGQARYVGASSMDAHQFAEALRTSERRGLERFVSMQNHYNLVYREEEREMLPLCQREGVGVIPWSPLGRGFLARPHEEFAETVRGRHIEGSRFAKRVDAYRANGGDEVNERVEELAEENGVKMAQIAIAWLLHREWVDAPIVGTTSIEHLEDAVEALEIDLSDSDLEYLEEPYGPVEVVGHE